jgi:hypothetical protein
MSTDGASGQPDEEPDRPREDRRSGKPADHHVSAQTEPETRTRQEYYDGGDQQHQQAIAGQVFAALESAGRWRAVSIDDMQMVLDSHQPSG